MPTSPTSEFKSLIQKCHSSLNFAGNYMLGRETHQCTGAGPCHTVILGCVLAFFHSLSRKPSRRGQGRILQRDLLEVVFNTAQWWISVYLGHAFLLYGGIVIIVVLKNKIRLQKKKYQMVIFDFISEVSPNHSFWKVPHCSHSDGEGNALRSFSPFLILPFHCDCAFAVTFWWQMCTLWVLNLFS